MLESSEASAKLILKWFTNNEIKAYPGNCHLLWSTKGGENRNIKWVNIENSQSENSDRNFKIKKGFLVYKILFFTKQIISCKYWDHNQVISSFCLRYWTWLKFIQIRHLIVLINYTWYFLLQRKCISPTVHIHYYIWKKCILPLRTSMLNRLKENLSIRFYQICGNSKIIRTLFIWSMSKKLVLNWGRRNVQEIKLIQKMLNELFHQGTRKSEHYGKK